ncbi:MAG: PH domain-containing protein [Planctomycetota bacterium]|nr:PH domain-containing protein [Planctomycetota bacterium]
MLARGHLHPAVLLLRLLSALRQSAFTLILGIVVDRWFLVLALTLFALQLGVSIVRYLTLEYTLTDEELRIREGLLHRQDRRIPLDRIQDLGFESTLLRRALGLAVVLVETASGRGVEARLDSLARADAEHLREVLLAARPASAASAAAARASDGESRTIESPEEAETGAEWVIHESKTRELLVRGATDLRLGAFAVTGYAAFEIADQLGFVTQIAGVARSFQAWLGTLSPALVFGVLAGLLFAVMAFGVFTSALGNLVQFHGFQLRLRGDVLQRRYGLLTTRQKTLPRARVQRVTIEQTWLRRLLGFAVVKADSAGGSRTDGQDTTGGWDVVVPMTRADAAHALLPALLPGMERERYSWQPGSAKLIARTACQGALLAALATAGFWWRLGPAALWALALIPLWAALGVLTWRNLGWSRGEAFFALQHGIIGKNFACVPTSKVQAIVIRQGLVGQLLGIADLTVYVAGGSPTRIPDLTLRDARQLQRELADRAATAAAADW